jgi:hypothetical protein
MQRAMAERNGPIPGRHRSGWTVALCRFLSGALLGRLRIPVSIALLTLAYLSSPGGNYQSHSLTASAILGKMFKGGDTVAEMQSKMPRRFSSPDS